MAKENPGGLRNNRIRNKLNISGIIGTLAFAAIVWYLASIVKYLNTGSTKHFFIFTGVATFTVLTLIIMTRFRKQTIVTKTDFIFHNVYHDIVIPLSAIRQVYYASVPHQEDYFRFHGPASMLAGLLVRLLTGKTFPSYTGEEVREKMKKSHLLHGWIDVDTANGIRTYLLPADQMTDANIPTKGSLVRTRVIMKQLAAALPSEKIDPSIESVGKKIDEYSGSK